ncbi:MAG: M14 family zinc carboxypeptidase [Thermoanaerobaculia bacterium]
MGARPPEGLGRRRLALASLLLVFLVLPVPGLAAAGDEIVRVHGVPPAAIDALREHGDVWGRNWRRDYVVMRVTPVGRAAVERLGYAVETDVEEMRRLEAFLAVDREAWRLSGEGGIPGFPCYRTVDETHDTLADLVAAHPQYARLELIGQTWQALNNGAEGDIFALVIGNQASPYERAPLVVMAAMHARELATAEAATRFAELLLEERATNGDIAWLLDHREIHVIAQENPDGRRKVEEGGDDLWWRKNHNETACLNPGPTGIDLNRNSSFLWGGAGSSGTQCSETYRGASPASEPETIALQAYLDEVFEDQWPPGSDPPNTGDPVPSSAQGVFLSLHSFGEYVLLPWEGLGGQNENNAPNHDELTILGRKFGFHTGYEVARWQALPPAAGTTVDYAYGEFGVAAYTFEMGTTFAQSCTAFESTIWPEVREALLYAAKAAERPYQAPWGPDVLDLDASFNPLTEQVHVSAVADDTRFFRGPVSEPPANDPIADIVSALASFEVPPHLADTTYPLTLDGSGAVVDLGGVIQLADGSDPPRLLFVVAADAEGHAGTPTAVLVREEPAPALAFDPVSLDFGDVPVGTESLPKLSTLTNSGTADATGLVFGDLENGFEADTADCGTVLAPAASCSVSVTFTPPAHGPAAATLTVASAEGPSADLDLAGNGVAETEVFAPAALAVDPSSGAASDGNGVFEPGELVAAAPAWRNDGALSHSLTGVASDFTGPAGATYSLLDDGAVYGDVDPGATASCLDAADCYQLGLNDPATRPATHWDAAFDETLSEGTTGTWALHIGDSFTDVPRTSLFYLGIETLLHRGVTGGCTATEYCPSAANSRDQMPVFLLKSWEGGDYVPPACVEGEELFADVPFDNVFCPWIEELAGRGVTAGCGGDNYCPNASVTRDQMAVFLLKTLEGAGYAPPPCNGVFADVPCPSLFADWIEELVARGITAGCGGGNYCPANPVSRDQMAVFLARTFGLTLYDP